MAEDLAALRAENRQLKQEILACNEQGRLFEGLLAMVGSAPEKEMLAHTMQQTLDITTRLSGAQTGSLFLLDESGLVTDAILTRGDVRPELKDRLVGTVLDKGLAGWVLDNLKVGLVRDTQTDDRWISLPDEPYEVRSVLSVPIIRHDAVFGILTLMHPDPDFFAAEGVTAVSMTADHMAVAIDGARMYLRLEELNRLRQKALERDLSLARQVQQSFLPAGMPGVAGYEFGAENRPAQAVGGDFYNFYPLPENRLGIAIGDVAGKGIAASLFMARLSSELSHFAPMFTDPGRLMAALNRELLARAKQGMFVTMVYLVMDTVTGEVLFSNAGHLPLLLKTGDEVTPVGVDDANGPPLGILSDAEYHTQAFSLAPGSTIVLYTDGVVEARDARGRIFGSDRLVEVLAQTTAAEPDGLIREIVRAVDLFSKGRGGGDDLTLVCVRRQAELNPATPGLIQ